MPERISCARPRTCGSSALSATAASSSSTAARMSSSYERTRASSISARARSTPAGSCRDRFVEQRTRPMGVACLEVIARRVDGSSESVGSRVRRRQPLRFLEQLGGLVGSAPRTRETGSFVERRRDLGVGALGREREVTGALLGADVSRERRMDVPARCRIGVGVRGGGQQRVRETDASAADRDEIGVGRRSERGGSVAADDRSDQRRRRVGERSGSEQRGPGLRRNGRHPGNDQLVQRIRHSGGVTLVQRARQLEREQRISRRRPVHRSEHRSRQHDPEPVLEQVVELLRGSDPRRRGGRTPAGRARARTRAWSAPTCAAQRAAPRAPHSAFAQPRAALGTRRHRATEGRRRPRARAARPRASAARRGSRARRRAGRLRPDPAPRAGARPGARAPEARAARRTPRTRRRAGRRHRSAPAWPPPRAAGRSAPGTRSRAVSTACSQSVVFPAPGCPSSSKVRGQSSPLRNCASAASSSSLPTIAADMR